MNTKSPSSTTSVPTASKLRLPATCEPPSEANPPKQAVWIIFGATGHIGRSLVRTALSHGDKVTAVGRTFENTIDQMSNWHEHCLGLLCDVRARETVDDVVQRSITHWGRVDIIANCTGYGIVAPAEEQSSHDLYNQFSTNFLGTLHILQSSLPYFRTHQIPGRYLIFSSIGGALGVPGLAPYCATKYAVEGLIESMLYETDCFGIKATLVEPGYLRMDDTPENIDDAGTSHISPSTITNAAVLATRTQGTKQIGSADPQNASRQQVQPDRLKSYGHFVVKPTLSSPYSSPHSPAGHAKRVFQWLDKRQPTSAVRSAELVWQLGHCSYPPLRLLLGNYAVDSIRDRLRSVIEEIEDWKFLSFAREGEGEGADAEGSKDGDHDHDHGDGYGDGYGDNADENIEAEGDAEGEMDVDGVEVQL